MINRKRNNFILKNGSENERREMKYNMKPGVKTTFKTSFEATPHIKY
jgi:hypothetical protein